MGRYVPAALGGSARARSARKRHDRRDLRCRALGRSRPRAEDRARDRDLWLVPRRQGASTVAVYAVMVDADSYGSAGIAGFWTGDPSGAGIAIPPVTEARARELGASAGVAVAAADLVWMTVAPI